VNRLVDVKYLSSDQSWLMQMMKKQMTPIIFKEREKMTR